MMAFCRPVTLRSTSVEGRFRIVVPPSSRVCAVENSCRLSKPVAADPSALVVPHPLLNRSEADGRKVVLCGFLASKSVAGEVQVAGSVLWTRATSTGLPRLAGPAADPLPVVRDHTDAARSENGEARPPAETIEPASPQERFD